MKLESRGRKNWWIVGVPSDVTECGPYSSKEDAEEDKKGLEKFFKENPEYEQ